MFRENQNTPIVGTDVFINAFEFNNSKIGKILISEPYPFALIKLFDPEFSNFKDKEIETPKGKVKIIING